MNFNKYACVINKLNEMAMDGSDTLLLKTAFLLKKVDIKVPGQLTPNHLTPESTHPIFGQLTLYMK